MTIESALMFVQQTGLYAGALVYFAVYPIATSVLWITTAWLFRLRWEDSDPPAPPQPDGWPTVSVLVPVRNEEAVIRRSLMAVLAMDYPHLDVIVIDDGSTDRTVDACLSLVANARVRLVRKIDREGKAMALNDALPLARGDLVLILGVDAEPAPDMLNWLVPHFQHARVAAVTGNPRVRNTDSFVARLQAIEYSSIVSLVRRSQRIWGRVTTIPGVVTLLRRSAVLDVGGFSSGTLTEDSDLIWTLQARCYDVRYEPRATCWMAVPHTLRALWRQRLGWARGQMQVMRRHCGIALDWRSRRMWPVLAGSFLSTLWSYCFVLLATIWAASHALGLPPAVAAPMADVWGMTIASSCLLQLAMGALIDRRYERNIVRYFPYAVWYPVVYWMFLAVAMVIALPHLFFRPTSDARHRIAIISARSARPDSKPGARSAR